MKDLNTHTINILDVQAATEKDALVLSRRRKRALRSILRHQQKTSMKIIVTRTRLDKTREQMRYADRHQDYTMFRLLEGKCSSLDKTLHVLEERQRRLEDREDRIRDIIVRHHQPRRTFTPSAFARFFSKSAEQSGSHRHEAQVPVLTSTR